MKFSTGSFGWGNNGKFINAEVGGIPFTAQIGLNLVVRRKRGPKPKQQQQQDNTESNEKEETHKNEPEEQEEEEELIRHSESVPAKENSGPAEIPHVLDELENMQKHPDSESQEHVSTQAVDDSFQEGEEVDVDVVGLSQGSPMETEPTTVTASSWSCLIQ